MNAVRFIALLLALALHGPLFAQSPPPSSESTESADAPSIPGITRVLIRTEKLASGSNFWVKNRNGDIYVMGWDKEEIYMSAEIRDTDRRRVELVIQRKNGGLDIETTFQQPFWSFDWGLVASPRCEMTIFVPRKLLGYFRTINGSLFVSYVDGYTRCETTNGDIQVKDVTGEAYVETKNGSVEGRDLEARIKAITTNGQVMLTNVSGKIEAETTNGNILAKNLNGWGEGISLGTTNGSIDIALGDATGEITADSTDGNLDIKIPDAKVITLSKRSARLRIPGRLQKINLKTTNGTITIRE
jgi:DUF4097 and DUF4098 domain-containing protein YvlB